MLMGDLYRVDNLDHHDDTIDAAIMLNPNHSIFKGHYPSQPVLPGACMVQIVKDVVELAIAQKVVLTKASQLKFLQMVTPDEDQALHLKIAYLKQHGDLKVTANLSIAETICFKFQGIFQIQ